ncbi:hypothetical protein CVT25_003009 [Psilocybe cyanescens]|uniref:Amino acid transporter transmembrane domain-containing protein n=1 Tax=Psilocybe cyanescens TaxID=93625 RepID=A0A409WN56_PSICY|nr:hypothetical protein CVT25_003009 [Psilocybe cyanescens]
MANAAVTDVASPGGPSRKLPALTMPFSSGGHLRRQSTVSSGSSDTDNEVYSPVLSALDSSAALILVHDQDEPASPLDLDDEDDRDNDQDIVSPMFEVRKSTVFPPLPPSLVFLFLLSPFLRLGAFELPNSQISLKYGLPALLLSALSTAFARQIWYMLARYLRKADMTDILLDTFAKGRGKDMQRTLIRGLVRFGSGTIAIGLAVTYLRYSVYTLHPLFPGKHHPIISYLISTLLVGVVVAYLSYARSLGSRRIVYATWLSLLTYIGWLGCTIYAHSHGLLETRLGWLGPPSVHQSLITSVLVFCSSSTLPLYVSLKTTSNPLSTGKSSRSRSFRVLSFLSVVVAVLLLLPSVIFSAFPNQPAVPSLPSQIEPPNENSTTAPAILVSVTPSIGNSTFVPILNSMPSLSPSLSPELALPTIQIQTIRHVLAAITLILGTPSIIITIPPFLIPIRSAKFNVSRVCTILMVLLFAMIPPRVFLNPETNESSSYLHSSGFFALLTILLLLMSFIGTYLLPAFLHALQHFVKRPLAIVVPPRTPLLQTAPGSSGVPSSHQSSPRAMYDELLLRKERALQQKQFRKRIVWDIGVWLLLGASGTGVVFMAVALLKSW